MQNWEIEMHRLLEIFEQESRSSLRKINGYLMASGKPFGEHFCKYFLKMSNLRLATSFNIVLFEHENRMQITPSFTHSFTSASISTSNGSEIPNNTNITNYTENHVNSSNAMVDGNSLGLQTRTNIDAPIEIADSSDDEEVIGMQNMLINSTETYALAQKIVLDLEIQNNVNAPIEIVDSDDEAPSAAGSHAISNKTPELNSGAGNSKHFNSNDEAINTDMNDQNGIEVVVKAELKMESPSETSELSFVVFDPNADNGDSDVGNGETNAEPLTDQNPQSTPSSAKDRSECEVVKRFKCVHCYYTAHQKFHLLRHQRTHADQKLMGVVQDPYDRSYKCTHCDQWFTTWRSLKGHLTQTHKNNQRLFNCVHCMRRFAQKTEKDRHEMQCQNRRYECYLCKTYVTRNVTAMQWHLRTHSGAKPFECAICNRHFQQKSSLRVHLNSVHSRTST